MEYLKPCVEKVPHGILHGIFYMYFPWYLEYVLRILQNPMVDDSNHDPSTHRPCAWAPLAPLAEPWRREY